MESYTRGERVYLRFQVENLQKKEFNISGAYYNLSINGQKLIEKGNVEYTADGYLKVLFEPKPEWITGQYVLDLWYDIDIADSDLIDTSNATERRTVRFLLPVVR